MHLVMFDIDGTLVKSSIFDEECYLKAANNVLGLKISSDWAEYSHTTDAGILNDVIIKYGIQGDMTEIQQEFKIEFENLISEYIDKNSNEVCQIAGASEFIQYLNSLNNVQVAVATGGWRETAELKLKAADISISDCTFASSSDHYSRTEIMKIAELRVGNEKPFLSKTYFGDGIWDKQASEDLNYRFVAVGNRINCKNQITDFSQQDTILKLLRL